MSTTTKSKYSYRSTKGSTLSNTVYEVRRVGETEPFATVVKTRDGGWYETPTWRAKSLADETVGAAGDSREHAVQKLEVYLLPTEVRERLEAESAARYEAERAAQAERMAQAQLDELHSSEHREEALVEAYHVLFDIKDAGDASRIADTKARAAWDAIQALDALMREDGIDVPRRFDGDGRTEANGGLS